ncbi:hypothetical protein B296_00005330 [Ensete ventricosum]|uniref:Uncharacterized protein n=1 Tax=Ensete ventricosum TaxID=4639 RepID=A0A427AZJ6_ENSVE|nr:hypothetical protein B296_00005330 [Ensete ventricosum]
MLGSSLQLGRRHGEDRFYTAAMALRGHHQNSLRTRSSAAASAAFLNPARLLAFKDKPVVGDRRQPEDRSSPSSTRAADASCNLDRFLESTTPSVLAHYLSKRKRKSGVHDLWLEDIVLCTICDNDCYQDSTSDGSSHGEHFSLEEGSSSDEGDAENSQGAAAAALPMMTYPKDNNCVPKISIPAFGLASYKFKNSLWTNTEGRERQLRVSLLQAADNWLRLLHVDHPDYQFFVSDGSCRR